MPRSIQDLAGVTRDALKFLNKNLLVRDWNSEEDSGSKATYE
jgi:hypothetical protein